jgi:hypothetical protein
MRGGDGTRWIRHCSLFAGAMLGLWRAIPDSYLLHRGQSLRSLQSRRWSLGAPLLVLDSVRRECGSADC